MHRVDTYICLSCPWTVGITVVMAAALTEIAFMITWYNFEMPIQNIGIIIPLEKQIELRFRFRRYTAAIGC